MSCIVPVIWLGLVVLMLTAMWKVFTKAGRPGWECIIPIYNTYVMLLIAGKPGWWLVLFFIPVVNLVVSIIAMVALAEAFGKSAGFGIGLAFLPMIFIPILGFGDAKYVRGSVPPPPPAPTA